MLINCARARVQLTTYKLFIRTVMAIRSLRIGFDHSSHIKTCLALNDNLTSRDTCTALNGLLGLPVSAECRCAVMKLVYSLAEGKGKGKRGFV